ncbi:MAG: FlgB family protein [Alphaproteobacteria bacterium]|nr:FlgB family protein [Alphaproteobacteria bacterium]
MFSDLKLLNLASAMARHAAARHEVLAENIANADTPGYKAKDLEPFAAAFQRALDEDGSTVAAAKDATWRVIAQASPGAMSPNGNSVSLEDQMIKSVEAQQDHDAATAIYKKSLDILRLTLGKA